METQWRVSRSIRFQLVDWIVSRCSGWNRAIPLLSVDVIHAFSIGIRRSSHLYRAHSKVHLSLPCSILRIDFWKWFLSISTQDKSLRSKASDWQSRTIDTRLHCFPNLRSADLRDYSQDKAALCARWFPAFLFQPSQSFTFVRWRTPLWSLEKARISLLHFGHSPSDSLCGTISDLFSVQYPWTISRKKYGDHVYLIWYGTLPVATAKALVSNACNVFLEFNSGVHPISGQSSTSAVHHNSLSNRDIFTHHSLAKVDPWMCSSRTSDDRCAESRGIHRTSANHRATIACWATGCDLSNKYYLFFRAATYLLWEKVDGRWSEKSQVTMGLIADLMSWSIEFDGTVFIFNDDKWLAQQWFGSHTYTSNAEL